ncbi:hypothetical protein VN97_g6165 [Penicillium thymicola]|uniref:Transmembrane protein n=1 Tax=Penicillium thymicola TaxID=293382 RepID=A0AAI9TI55_PENTH|nr:hypothetical protein VN97_g6165 [Penicillium thymicola]
MSAFGSRRLQVSSVEGKNPQTQQVDLDPGYGGVQSSHKCIGDLEDFFGYTFREDPSMMVNLSSCSARIPIRSSLLRPCFLFFFLFAISLYQIHRARLVPRSSDLPAMSYMSFQFSSRRSSFLFFFFPFFFSFPVVMRKE